MMNNVVRLPADLKSLTAPERLNRELRAGTARLDWSAVREAPSFALALLLQGLDLTADALGLETVPSDLKDTVTATLDGEEPGTPRELVLVPPSRNDIRDELESIVIADLLGPAGGPEEEVAERRVSERYLTGMLAPRRVRLSPEEFDELAVGGEGTPEEGTTDTSVPQTSTMFPSSFGMSFSVSGEAEALRITARWGRYHRTSSETLQRKDGGAQRVWKREPVEGVLPPVPLVEGDIPEQTVSEEQPEVVVRGLIRRHGEGWIVTLFLVNGQTEPQQNRDGAWIFQPELIAESPYGTPIFLQRPTLRDPDRMDPATYDEESAMAMVYRHEVGFAVGHNVSVHAQKDPEDPRRATRLSTSVIPSHDVPKTTPPTLEDIPALKDLVLDMKELSETPTAELPRKLSALPDAYQVWIEEQRAKISDPEEELAEHADTAREALEKCSRTLERIRDGIALLTENEQAAEAFRFANRAMHLQRTRSIYAEETRRGSKPELASIDVPRNRTWYPFQLAFILLNLPGITDLLHPERSDESQAVADLFWFPTGGGKTEAYLGLTAYTMGLRRLQGAVAGRSGESGVAVLMRYTLRLLTLQQFQRASTLVCACEAIRREAMEAGDAWWGAEPFRIGLWVGQRATPNKTADSAEAVKKDHGAFGGASGGTPAQLLNCPWCGIAIDKGKHIKVETYPQGQARTLTYCGDPFGRCLFSAKRSPGEGLPVIVVDEEIYRRLPTLLISTVDKFAQMPWQGATQTLFGRVEARCERHGFRSPEIEDKDTHPKRGLIPGARSIQQKPLRPPDLIIQDELHLISGPLGTLVGLYETAVDRLSSWEVNGKRVRPKVIASTATIRRAPDQVHSLFLRDVEVFPPQGLDVRDNFFSVQREPGEKYPGRRYLGVCAPGKRLKAALIRVYVAHLAAAQSLYEKYGKAADPWMTLVGYFNSMRELGGMRRLVDDDVRVRLQYTESRGLAKRKRPPRLEELTSRKSSADIPLILDRLETSFDPEKEGRGKDSKGGTFPLDVLLATNMISVGVDVSRLGLMVVAGQPKTTAEYIQATSRVGRRAPGLVCTVFNWARARDLSHYERFGHYHATFYQHVEALSVTPFAARALDRGLTALLVSLVRLADEEYNENSRAEAVDRNSQLVKEAVEGIVRRAEEVTGRKDVGEDVRAMLTRRLDEWRARADALVGGGRLGYREKKDGVTKGLLHAPGPGEWDDFTCLNSLRDVEPTVSLVLSEGGLDDDAPAGSEGAGA